MAGTVYKDQLILPLTAGLVGASFVLSESNVTSILHSATIMADKKVTIVNEVEAGVIPLEKLEGTGTSMVVLTNAIINPDAEKSAAEQADLDRKVLWKIDWNLMPWLCLIYLLCFLDRTNIGMALR